MVKVPVRVHGPPWVSTGKLQLSMSGSLHEWKVHPARVPWSPPLTPWCSRKADATLNGGLTPIVADLGTPLMLETLLSRQLTNPTPPRLLNAAFVQSLQRGVVSFSARPALTLGSWELGRQWELCLTPNTPRLTRHSTRLLLVIPSRTIQ